MKTSGPRGGCPRSNPVLTGLMVTSVAWAMAGTWPAEAKPPASGAARWRIDDPWVREAPPGSRVLAAYGTIHGLPDRPGALIKLESPAFGRIETHAMSREGSMMRMKAVPRLEVPARGQVKLEPGEWHWMLYEPRRPLIAGDQVDVVFQFSDGSRLARKLPVRRYPAP
ncbi:MAG: copper chaperone PCu(A)C [bacterium]|nr:copper chaperone PCu(A)C [bacterium]